MIEDPVVLGEWHAVAAVDQVEPGRLHAARLLEEDLLIWRSNEGPRAWQDLCMHRGARLSLGRVEDGCVVCPYHGWTYDAAGRCVRIPAHPDQTPPSRARVHAYWAVERYGVIWTCLGEPTVPEPPPFPEWDDTAFRAVLCGPYRFQAGAPRTIENFLDVTHFPFVHEGLLGEPSRPQVSEYEPKTGPDGIVAPDIRVWQPDPDGRGEGSWVSYTYRVLRPLAASFTKDLDGRRFSMLMSATPVSETETLGWMWVAMNYGEELSDEQIRSFQDRVALQDVPIVESQRPERLPLDLQAELHLRSDRTAIAYRRWLRELGLTFGTA